MLDGLLCIASYFSRISNWTNNCFYLVPKNDIIIILKFFMTVPSVYHYLAYKLMQQLKLDL